MSKFPDQVFDIAQSLQCDDAEFHNACTQRIVKSLPNVTPFSRPKETP
jgi:hypothetical protein